jgi:hypothetical protein
MSSIHNAQLHSHAVTVLPFDIKAQVVKICKYFFIHTVHVAQLKEFYDFADLGV